MKLERTNAYQAVEKNFSALGTRNNIRIFEIEKEDLIEHAIRRVAEIENRMSAYQIESDISKLHRSSGQRFRTVHSDTFQVICKAIEFGCLSDGAFDISVRPLTELWGINKKENFIPSDEEIKKALALVNYRDIQTDPKRSGVLLKKAGQALDLGGIAKGFAADEVRKILLQGGVQSALINLGGNIIAVGCRPDGTPWQIGIQNPLAPTGQFLGVLSAADKTIVTSGSNERFFIKDGIRYHHILDPRTGKPACSSLLSVTVVCSCSMDADALTTALFILGKEKGMPLLEKQNAQAVFVAEDLSVTVSPGLKDLFIKNEKVEIL